MPLALTIALQVLSSLPSLIEAAEGLFTAKGKRKAGAKRKKQVMAEVKKAVNQFPATLTRAEKKEILDAASGVTDAIVAASKVVNTPA